MAVTYFTWGYTDPQIYDGSWGKLDSMLITKGYTYNSKYTDILQNLWRMKTKYQILPTWLCTRYWINNDEYTDNAVKSYSKYQNASACRHNKGSIHHIGFCWWKLHSQAKFSRHLSFENRTLLSHCTNNVLYIFKYLDECHLAKVYCKMILDCTDIFQFIFRSWPLIKFRDA